MMKSFSNMQNIWLHFGFGESRKNKRLKRLLGAEGVWCFLMLLLYTGKARPTGILTGLSEEDIAEESGWITDEHYKKMSDTEIEVHVEKYIDALIKSKWLKCSKNVYLIPSFAENNPQLQPEYREKRSEDAKKKADKRWDTERRKKTGLSEEEISSVSETDVKKFRKNGDYPVKFDKLPNDITIYNAEIDEYFHHTKKSILDIFFNIQNDPEHKAAIYTALKQVRKCSCGAHFINTDTRVKSCHECQG